MKAKSCLVLLCLALASPAINAEVYTWKDKNGNVQYSDVPPSGVSTPVTVRSNQPSALPTSSPAEDKSGTQEKKPADKKLEALQKNDEIAKQKEKKAQESANQAIKAQNCERAQSRLKALQSGIRIKQMDKEGHQSYMDDNQRTQELADTQRSIDENCN